MEPQQQWMLGTMSVDDNSWADSIGCWVLPGPTSEVESQCPMLFVAGYLFDKLTGLGLTSAGQQFLQHFVCRPGRCRFHECSILRNVETLACRPCGMCYNQASDSPPDSVGGHQCPLLVGQIQVPLAFHGIHTYGPLPWQFGVHHLS